MPKNNYTLKLKGYVGSGEFSADYVDFVLDKNKDTNVTVLIDSLGGSLATALTICSAFKNHKDVNVHFTGMNASAATIASLGAKHITMDSSAMYLVHKCSSSFFEWGSLNSDQLSTLIEQCQKMQNDLDKMDANVAEMYAARCKKTPAELLNLMKEGAWLTSKEALAWGFVDELTDYDDDTAPVLTEAVVASMNEVGMPIPDLPVTDKTSGFGRFMNALYAFFNQNKNEGPEENKINKVTNTTTMNKTFTSICALLALDALAETDGKFAMSNENLQTIEDALKEKDSDIKAKADEITALKAQVEALKAAPGSSTTHVVDEKNPKAEKSDVEKYIDTMNSARAFFNMLP